MLRASRTCLPSNVGLRLRWAICLSVSKNPLESLHSRPPFQGVQVRWTRFITARILLLFAIMKHLILSTRDSCDRIPTGDYIATATSRSVLSTVLRGIRAQTEAINAPRLFVAMEATSCANLVRFLVQSLLARCSTHRNNGYPAGKLG